MEDLYNPLADENNPLMGKFAKICKWGSVFP
jgi:hypothetical protein